MKPSINCIRPDETYDIATAAAALNMSTAAFEKRWIKSGKMRFIPNGNAKSVIGEHIRMAFMNEAVTWDEWKAQQDESESSTSQAEADSPSDGKKKAAGVKGSPKLRIDD